MPMLRRTNYGAGNHKWLASAHGTQHAPTGTLSVESFTAATHYPEGYIPSGTPVNCDDLTALTPYTAPAEGAPANLGFLLDDVQVVDGQAAPVAVLRHGAVVADEVPGDFTAPASAPGWIFE